MGLSDCIQQIPTNRPGQFREKAEDELLSTVARLDQATEEAAIHRDQSKIGVEGQLTIIDAIQHVSFNLHTSQIPARALDMLDDTVANLVNTDSKTQESSNMTTLASTRAESQTRDRHTR